MGKDRFLGLRRNLIVSIIAICTLANSQTWATGKDLTATDINKLKEVCHSLIGVEGWRLKDIFRQQLKPYIRSKDALEESTIVECSFRCGGTLKLRGDADIFYGFSNQPPNAAHRVDTVALHIHGKRVLAIGPGTESYPYPYYDAEHKR